MKKLISIILTLVIILGLCACGGEGGEQGGSNTASGLQVGYGRAKIMPTESVPLGGYGNGSTSRMSEGYLNYLYATCIAFKDGDETILLFNQDTIASREDATKIVRDKITEATGVPGDHIMITATHTHSGPDQDSSHASIERYNEGPYATGFLEAAQTALADLAPATLYSTSVEVEGLNFVRHYLMNDGTYYGSNFGSSASGIKDYAMEKDDEMILVKAEREGDKKDILLMNWQGHPCFDSNGGKDRNLSNDYIGAIRDSFESQTDMHFAYVLGATGNMVTDSQIKADEHGLNRDDYGAAAAKHAIDALPDMQPVEGAGIKISRVMFEATVNHDDDDKLEQAKEVKDAYSESLAYQYGFNSVHEARAIVRRYALPATMDIELNAFYIGELAFITAPYEMFSTSAMDIKARSPFDTTVICTCANEHYSYIPTQAAIDYDSYESNNSNFVRGTSETLVDQFVTMLEDLKG